MLRLINIAFDASFYFSIDNHKLTVVSTDFVPIKPYTTDAVIIGIGQRYNVIVEANPIDDNGNPIKSLGPFWIRTRRAECFGFKEAKKTSPGYQNTGILRYRPGKNTPTTPEHPVNITDCTDEPYKKLSPIVPWNVAPPVNGDKSGFGENFTLQFNGDLSTFYPVAFFSLSGIQYNPIKVDYGNPTFLNLNNTGPWNPLWTVYPEDYPPIDGSTFWVSSSEGRCSSNAICVPRLIYIGLYAH
jgi:Multicopper oxidase